MTADLLALLDQLDEARAKATPGPWAQHGADPSYVIGDISDGGESYLDVTDAAVADAALIVAVVNALPTLVSELRKHDAALRAVESLIDPETGMATGNGYDATRLFSERDIRRALDADALTPSWVQP